jgi:hypothetical protein
MYLVLKLQTGDLGSARSWFEGRAVVITPELLLPEKTNPFLQNLNDLIAYREEESVEGLAELRSHLSGILMDTSGDQVYILQFHGGNGAVSCAREKRKCDNSPVTAIDLGSGGHRVQNMLDLIDGRCSLFSLCRGYPGVLLGQVEILRIRVLKSRFVTWLSCQPVEKVLELRESHVQSCLT